MNISEREREQAIVKSQIINKLNLNSGNFKVKTWMRWCVRCKNQQQLKMLRDKLPTNIWKEPFHEHGHIGGVHA